MITWGISANSHNAAVAVFDDKRLIFASETERYSGIKNDPHLNKDLIYELHYQGLTPDRIVWYEKPLIKTLRQLIAGQGLRLQENNVKNYLKEYLPSTKLEFAGHHHSHAAGGYYTSGWDEACVVVIDAIGEFETATIWHGKGNNLKKLWSLSYPHSIGLFYSAMTQRVGLKPNEEEYILMGMSAFGKADSLYFDMSHDFIDNYENLKFIRNCHRGVRGYKPQETEFNIAATTQKIYEDYFEHLLIKAKRLTKCKNLVLSGGCALNCVANRITGRYFDKTWIMPAPGDSGSSIGSVLAVDKKHINWNDTFLGHNIIGTAANANIVTYLEKYSICGLARGRAEFGPRALGNRSLLADPRGPDIKDKVNAIKQRQKFRPFAPAILEELVHDYFDMPSGWDNSRYMQVIARCRFPDLFPAIVHRDGTSRVQTVPKDGSKFRELLELWYARTGCPMLLNTSLNIKGKPMVNNRDDALDFQNTYKVKVFT
jgi:carbamoyltransferase